MLCQQALLLLNNLGQLRLVPNNNGYTHRTPHTAHRTSHPSDCIRRRQRASSHDSTTQTHTCGLHNPTLPHPPARLSPSRLASRGRRAGVHFHVRPDCALQVGLALAPQVLQVGGFQHLVCIVDVFALQHIRHQEVAHRGGNREQPKVMTSSLEHQPSAIKHQLAPVGVHPSR